ncbi:MAG: biopolymer transporter ExbD [Holosporales bacterium]|jgi:biopolymer transport protein TolR|nr:biopolymer transporter ExbD [Holosporales bacterium]
MVFRKNNKRIKNQVHINVAPLVDVMLVLMVIFMMTSQIATIGINVDLPKTTSQKQQKINDKDHPIVITIDKNAEIYLEEANLSMEELLKKLPLILNNNKSDVVYVKGDKDLQYGKIIEIMGIISNSGICKVALIAEILRNTAK